MTLNLDRSTWTRVKFGDVIQNVSDRVDDPSQAGVERYVGLEHLDPGSMTIQRWGTPDQVEAQKLRFRPGDVIFGRRRAYQKKVARADFEGICSAHALVLRAKPGLIDPDFLPAFLSSDTFLDRAVQISVGSLSPTVNWKTLAVQEFDLPPLGEQKRIADLLWAAERRRQAASDMLGSIDALTFAHAVQHFGGAAERVPLDDIVVTILDRRGVTPKKLGGDFQAEGRRVISAMNIKKGAVDLTLQPRFVSQEIATKWMVDRLRGGDILLTSEAPLGAAALLEADSEWVLGQRLFAIRTDPAKMLPEYLFAWLQSGMGQSALAARGSGSTVTGIRQAELRKVLVPMPSLVEQTQFLDRHRSLLVASEGTAAEQQSAARLLTLLRQDVLGVRT